MPNRRDPSLRCGELSEQIRAEISGAGDHTLVGGGRDTVDEVVQVILKHAF